MHRLGTVLAPSYHDDDLRHAAQMRALEVQPKSDRVTTADEKPTLRRRLASAFRPLPIRPAGA